MYIVGLHTYVRVLEYIHNIMRVDMLFVQCLPWLAISLAILAYLGLMTLTPPPILMELIQIMDTYSLAHINMNGSWIVCIGLSTSIVMIFFALGISAGDLGSHSARKGSASHACAGTTVSPLMVSVCLCAMWSMGHIKER